MEIKEYFEMEVWNPNKERQDIYDEDDDFYGVYYDEVWNIDKRFKLYYQRYLQEQQQHILQIQNNFKNKREDMNQNLNRIKMIQENYLKTRRSTSRNLKYALVSTRRATKGNNKNQTYNFRNKNNRKRNHYNKRWKKSSDWKKI